ncbi:hypothetical protein M408DRAFT_248729 [Serendipita vermifera MAFF 305830]|uniref:Uncharacterized protein n=1 Tax=Serendipita vermifera MAFF 305830 TaxID=933852 RepID=A0A0C3AXA8_SERVB|nr:hypothetical protein M408DRAFT_248729 [Serendipita vermifera MAFF 305830]
MNEPLSCAILEEEFALDGFGWLATGRARHVIAFILQTTNFGRVSCTKSIHRTSLRPYFGGIVYCERHLA